jgi:hypothetical protein
MPEFHQQRCVAATHHQKVGGPSFADLPSELKLSQQRPNHHYTKTNAAGDECLSFAAPTSPEPSTKNPAIAAKSRARNPRFYFVHAGRNPFSWPKRGIKNRGFRALAKSFFFPWNTRAARPKQFSTCKNVTRKALRDEAKEIGVVDPKLVKIREQDNQNKREQRKSAKENGCAYDKRDQRPCKGPDGLTGSGCPSYRKSDFSLSGFAFCTTCYRKAFPDDHAAVLSVRKKFTKTAVTKKCVGQEPNGGGKFCPHPIRLVMSALNFHRSS